MSASISELAALATSVLISFTYSFFTHAGRYVGDVILNRVQLLLAATFHVLIHFTLLVAPYLYQQHQDAGFG